MERKRVELEPFWSRRPRLLTFLIALATTLLGLAEAKLLATAGVPRWDLIVIGNVTTGIIAGCLFYQFARNEEKRRARVRERMKTVAELNHHIRNALQVIKLCGAQPDSSLDARPLQLIKESADRIEWAMREVLPKYPVNDGAFTRQPPVGYAAVASSVQQPGPFSDPGQEARLH